MGGLKFDEDTLNFMGNKRVYKLFFPKGQSVERVEDTTIMLPKNVLSTCPAFVDEINLLLVNENPEMEYPEVITFSIEKFLSGG